MISRYFTILLVLLYYQGAFSNENNIFKKKYNVFIGPLGETKISSYRRALDGKNIKYKLNGKKDLIIFHRSATKPSQRSLKLLFDRLGSIANDIKLGITYDKGELKKSSVADTNKALESNKSLTMKSNQEIAFLRSSFTGRMQLFSQFLPASGENLTVLLSDFSSLIPLFNSAKFSYGLIGGLDYVESEDYFIEPRSLNFRLQYQNFEVSVGSQVVSWGRVFEGSIIDGFNRQLLSYGTQLTLKQRSLDQIAARAEIYFSDLKIDRVVVPYFQGNRFPNGERPWTLFSRERGEFVLGPSADEDPIFSELVKLSELEDRPNDQVAWGLRVTKDSGSFSWGATFLSAPSLNPYYSINPITLSLLGGGSSVSEAVLNTPGAEFFANHPKLTTVAFDGFLDSSFGGIRFEVGYEEGTPMTSIDFEYLTRSSLKWNVSLETFIRGQQDTLNVLISGNNLISEIDLLEFENQTYITIQYTFDLSAYNLKIIPMGSIGLHAIDRTLQFTLEYKPMRNQTFSLVGTYFDGEPFTISNFYEDFNFISIGWQLHF